MVVNEFQLAKLDRVAEEDAAARVVGLGSYGPVVAFSDGRLREISRRGRLVADTPGILALVDR